jgi:hypothetical protein
MKKSSLSLALLPLVPLSLATLSSANAAGRTSSLNWEHSLTTRTDYSKYPVARLKIYNNWTPTRHRMLVKYNVLGLGAQSNWASKNYGPSFSMPNFDPSRILSRASYHHGTFGSIERLDDDKFIMYNSQTGEYYSEPRDATMKRLRFDPWKKIAPELSKQDPPSFTPEQRARLGQEVRAGVKPFLKKAFKSYFRALPESRVFDVGGEKISTRGYRMTLLVNAGSFESKAKWLRLNFEWWLAPAAPGDEVLASYGARYLADLNGRHGLTTSMWMNEAAPVMWEMMPQELHQAVATFLPKGIPFVGTGENAFKMGGAPVYLAATLAPPPGDEKLSSTGNVRIEMQLNKRDTRTLDNQVFEAPPEYKKASLEPFFTAFDESMNMIQSLYDDEMRLSDASASNRTQPRYSWDAMRQVLRALNETR